MSKYFYSTDHWCLVNSYIEVFIIVFEVKWMLASFIDDLNFHREHKKKVLKINTWSGSIPCLRCHDIQHKDTQHNGRICDTEHKRRSAYMTFSMITLCIECHYAECPYAEYRYVVCRCALVYTPSYH